MVDRCTITRPGIGQGGYDPVTMRHADPPTTVVWAGPCRVKTSTLQVEEAATGPAVQALGRPQVHLPVPGTHGVRRGDRVRVDIARTDPALTGAVLTLTQVPASTAATARRCTAEEVL